MPPGVAVEVDVLLASLTSLELGGRARYVLTPTTEAGVRETHAWARAAGCPLFVLGGGSNVVAADADFPGAILRTTGLRGETERGETVEAGHGPEVRVTVAAGEPWDAWVAACVDRGWAGVECLAGIPGLVGATPIQNVGAYGQEVAETIRAVRVLDRARDAIVTLDARDCRFGYRDSVFRRNPEGFVVLAVTFALRPGGAPTVRYAELAAALAAGPNGANGANGDGADDDGADGELVPPRPGLAQVRQTVRRLRRRKSMLLDDPTDENRRSVGSFFTNPVVTQEVAADVEARARALGLLSAPGATGVPQFPTPDGRVKLAAGWLIEHAGFARGQRQGAVGLSTRHALALVNLGGGTTAALLELARAIREAVLLRFGVGLDPEPVLLGTTWPLP
jgi:UDP-N-acetylmuramate dehydrogenase